MNQVSGKPFTAYVGMDWATAKHDICLQVAGSGDRAFDRIAHKPEAIEAWAQGLFRRFGAPIAVALELSEGPIVSALEKYEFLVIFPIDPKRLAKYREAFTPSGAKDDPTDAEFSLDYLMRHPERLTALNPQSVAMRKLRYLVEARDRLKGDQSRSVNRLVQALKQYYPQVLDWFDSSRLSGKSETWDRSAPSINPLIPTTPTLGKPHSTLGFHTVWTLCGHSLFPVSGRSERQLC